MSYDAWKCQSPEDRAAEIERACGVELDDDQQSKDETVGRKDLGWGNTCMDLFARYKQCGEKGHKIGDTNLDPSNHGYDRLLWCDTCGYQFHVDSSD